GPVPVFGLRRVSHVEARKTKMAALVSFSHQMALACRYLSTPESSGRPLTLYPLCSSTDLWACRYLAVVLDNKSVSAGTWRSAGCLRSSVHGARPPRASSHLTHSVFQGWFDDGRRDSQYVRAGLADDDEALAGPRVGRASPAPTARTDAALPD